MEHNIVRLFLMCLVGADLTWINWAFIGMFAEKQWVRITVTALITILTSWLFVKLFI